MAPAPRGAVRPGGSLGEAAGTAVAAPLDPKAPLDPQAPLDPHEQIAARGAARRGAPDPSSPAHRLPFRLDAPRDEEYAARNERARRWLEAAASAGAAERLRLTQCVVLEYLELAEAVANRFRHLAPDPEELRQVAYLGLIQAIWRFDPRLGEEIAAFAVPTIAGEIKRHLRDRCWAIRPPRSVQELASRLHEQRTELSQRLGREPSVHELARACGTSTERVAEALRSARARHPESFDVAPGDEARALASTIADGSDDFARVERTLLVEQALACLAPADRHLLRLRFDEELTQAEIAGRLGISQMQVSRRLGRALRLLRERLEHGDDLS